MVYFLFSIWSLRDSLVVKGQYPVSTFISLINPSKPTVGI